MASAFKSLVRKALRFYLTHTPIKRGRYPLMMLGHKFAAEPITVEVDTKDRGKMILDLDDLMQYPVYYNLFEAKYEKVMNRLLQDTDITIDVGGNIGQYALLFAKYSKKVFTFEPMPMMIDRLKKHIDLNHLQDTLILVSKALSNSSGVLKFALPNSANSGTASTILGRKANLNENIEVEAITLDEFASAMSIQGRVDLIKIDIEGGELFALQGMKELLAGEHKPALILEMNDEMMHLAGYTSKDIQNYLANFYYQAFEITKSGLRGPVEKIASDSENYCFLDPIMINIPRVRSIIY